MPSGITVPTALNEIQKLFERMKLDMEEVQRLVVFLGANRLDQGGLRADTWILNEAVGSVIGASERITRNGAVGTAIDASERITLKLCILTPMPAKRDGRVNDF